MYKPVIASSTSPMPSSANVIQHQPIQPMPPIGGDGSTITFQPASAYGFVGLGESTAAQDAGYQQTNKAPPPPAANYPQQPAVDSYVVRQPIVGTNVLPGYGTMMSGGVASSTVYGEPPTTHVTHHTIIVDDLRVVGGCPVCRIGVLEDNYPACALCCAIVFFPAGILCCLCMRNRRCSHCSTEF